MKIKQQTIKCLRCNHTWVPRIQEVRECPKCKSSKFDIPKEK